MKIPRGDIDGVVDPESGEVAQERRVGWKRERTLGFTQNNRDPTHTGWVK